MLRISQEILDSLREFDSPTLFNAVTRLRGTPGEDYTDHTIRCLLPELGAVIGYACTAEVTTNDPDSPALDWLDYYALLEETPGPLIAVLKDVDSRPGRGASFGDGMATVHQRLGLPACWWTARCATWPASAGWACPSLPGARCPATAPSTSPASTIPSAWANCACAPATS